MKVNGEGRTKWLESDGDSSTAYKAKETYIDLNIILFGGLYTLSVDIKETYKCTSNYLACILTQMYDLITILVSCLHISCVF